MGIIISPSALTTVLVIQTSLNPRFGKVAMHQRSVDEIPLLTLVKALQTKATLWSRRYWRAQWSLEMHMRSPISSGWDPRFGLQCHRLANLWPKFSLGVLIPLARRPSNTAGSSNLIRPLRRSHQPHCCPLRGHPQKYQQKLTAPRTRIATFSLVTCATAPSWQNTLHWVKNGNRLWRHRCQKPIARPC